MLCHECRKLQNIHGSVNTKFYTHTHTHTHITASFGAWAMAFVIQYICWAQSLDLRDLTMDPKFAQESIYRVWILHI